MSVDDLRRSMAAVSPGEETYAAIRRAILEGSLRPGERIVEQQLAESLNVSRTPVREALLKLERENLVARMGRGMAVRTYSSDEVRDIYDLRAQIEGYCGARGVRSDLRGGDHGTRAGAGRARGGARAVRPRRCGQPGTLGGSEPAFSRGGGACGAQCAARALFRCRSSSSRCSTRRTSGTTNASRRSSASDHRRLWNCSAHTTGAAAEMVWRRHIERGRDMLVEHLTATRTSEQ